MKSTFLYLILLSVFLLDLLFVWNDSNEPRFFTKTLLLPLLIVIYLVVSQQNSVRQQPRISKTFLAGLIFSFFGDLFLLFNWGFLPGLGSFLLAHVFYILCFSKLRKKTPPVFSTMAVAVYLVALIVFLFPHLDEMKIPVIIYGSVISVMFWFSISTGQKLLVFGALLFVVSDTVLAVNIFVNQHVALSLIVMITYVAAQFLLVRGMLKANQKNT